MQFPSSPSSSKIHQTQVTSGIANPPGNSSTSSSSTTVNASDSSNSSSADESTIELNIKQCSTPTPRVLNSAGGMLVDGAATVVRTIVGVPPERIKSICHQQKIYPWEAVKQMSAKDMYKGVGYAGIFNLSQVPMKQTARRIVSDRAPDLPVWQKTVSAAALSTVGEVGVGYPLYKLFFYSADRKTNDLVGVAKHMYTKGGPAQFYHGVGFRTLLHLKFNTACFGTMDVVAPWLKEQGWSDSSARIASGFSGAAAGTLANHHMDILCTHAAVMEPSKDRPTHFQMLRSVGEAEQERIVQRLSGSNLGRWMGKEALESSQALKQITLFAGVYRAALPALPAKFIALVPSMGAAMGVGSALTAHLKGSDAFSKGR